MTNTFGSWDTSIHELPDQLKRIASAKKKETSWSSIDKTNFKAIFPGSGEIPYKTSLYACSCEDFARRHLPCKHMYRLAIDCGFFPGSTGYGANKNTYVSIQDVVATLENYNDDVQHLILTIVRGIISKSPIVECYVTENNSSVLTFPYLQFKPSSTASIMHDYRKSDIILILEQQKALPEQKMQKADLIKYCESLGDGLRNVLPKKYEVEAIPIFSKAIRKLENYLVRKYEWRKDTVLSSDESTFIKIWIPARSKPASELLDDYYSGGNELYYFPNDEITTLLTQYGMNRCVNGFVPLTANPCETVIEDV